ncbi:MAG: hypothetical protein LBQ24_02590 [Candidatus Peribacteria bacterium]|jgi:hypothetical protein|nr:hypothetical protein [Candidatus Peribacteria bacterium]
MKKEKELAKIPDEFNENDFEENLTPKQRLFCFHFVKNKATKFNATLSYNKAYEI